MWFFKRVGNIKMQALYFVLCRMVIAMATLLLLDIGNPKAATPSKDQNSKVLPQSKTLLKTKKKPQTIVGEMEDTDTAPIEEEEISSDETGAASVKMKNTYEENTEETKHNKLDKKKKKIREGFRQAHKFHETWHHLPPAKVKCSLENLINFCKVACIKKHCMDKKIADQCHLMCPESTTKQCPDPLNDSNHNIDGEEVAMESQDNTNDVPFPANRATKEDPISSGVSASIAQAEKNIADLDLEG